MGYYIKLKESTVILPKHHLEEAFKCFIALETNYDHLKRGSSFSGERWFSWMNDWQDECSNAIQVLERLGFTCEETETSYLITDYESKIGQEDLFFRAITHLVNDDSYMIWEGEDGARWAWAFECGIMYIVEPNKTTEFMPDFNNPFIKEIGDGN